METADGILTTLLNKYQLMYENMVANITWENGPLLYIITNSKKYHVKGHSGLERTVMKSVVPGRRGRG